MKNKNKSLIPNDIISKIKTWFYNLFHKSKSNENELDNSSSLIKENNNKTQKSFFEECKEKSERRQYLLALQKRYKNKEILEKDMNEQDRIDLEKLYVEQNLELKREINAINAKIAEVKSEN